MARFTLIPEDTFQHLQINAGILVTGFTPNTGEYEKLIASTSGGISFNSNPTFSDFGEDIDNCPRQSKELKRVISYDPVLSGTMLTIDNESVKRLMGAATTERDTTADKASQITPTMELIASDFETIWFVGDYSHDNSDQSGGFIAIELINALNTTGFQLQTTNGGKGQFSFEFHGHASITSPHKVPFNVYIKGGATNE